LVFVAKFIEVGIAPAAPAYLAKLNNVKFLAVVLEILLLTLIFIFVVKGSTK
jgi:uncharacterized integral membrane protein